MTTRARGGDPLWAVVLGILLLVALAIAAATGAAIFAKKSIADRGSPEAIDAALSADAHSAVLFEAIREDFPEEYTRIRDALAKDARDGLPPPVLRQRLFAMMRATSLEHMHELAQAPHAALAAFNAAEARMIEGLEADDVELCARYVMNGFGPGDTIPPRARQALSDMGVAQWRAAAAGRDWPADRKIGRVLPPRDAEALVAAMRAQGMGDKDLEIFATPALWVRAEPWRQCATGKWLVSAVGKLPAEQGDRVTAWLIQQKQPG